MTGQPDVVVPDFSDLVKARKSCRICIDRNPGEIRNGAEYDFDPDVVSHWSQWLGDRNPEILVIGQDFGDIKYFREHRGKDENNNVTNNTLHALLECAGIKVAKPPKQDNVSGVFLTNSILCFKNSPMSSGVRSHWTKACACNHLRHLIERLQPRIVVAMGSHGWLAARVALQLENVPKKILVAVGSMWAAPNGIRVFPVSHCSGLGQVNRPLKQQREDWMRIGVEVMSPRTPGAFQ
jgi:uracil-DNA glycosylase